MPTVEELQVENARLRAENDSLRSLVVRPSPTWGDNLASVVDYITANKVKLATLVLAAVSFAGVVWNRIAPATDRVAVQEVAHEEVREKVPAAVNKAVRDMPAPAVVREVPVSPGTVKTNEEKR